MATNIRSAARTQRRSSQRPKRRRSGCACARVAKIDLTNPQRTISGFLKSLAAIAAVHAPLSWLLLNSWHGTRVAVHDRGQESKHAVRQSPAVVNCPDRSNEIQEPLKPWRTTIVCDKKHGKTGVRKRAIIPHLAVEQTRLIPGRKGHAVRKNSATVEAPVAAAFATTRGF